MPRPKGSRNKKNNIVKQEEKEDRMTDTAVLETIETEIDTKRIELEKLKNDIEERCQELKKMSNRQIDDDEMNLMRKSVTMTHEKQTLKDKIAAQKAYDDVLVTGKFINRRHPGGSTKLTYLKYETDVPKWWPFDDGKVYTIPRGLADQINEHYYKPHFIQKSNDILDPNRPESVIQDVDTSNKLYSFVPVNF